MTREEIFRKGIESEVRSLSFWKAARYNTRRNQCLADRTGKFPIIRAAVEYNSDVGEYFFVVYWEDQKEIFSLDEYKRAVRQLRDSLNKGENRGTTN